MRMTFSPWSECPARNANSFATFLRRAARDLRRQALLSSSTLELQFHIIDVTKASEEPVELLASLKRLLVGSDSLPEKRGCRKRLLFVGETSSLDQWEEEGPGSVSAKKSTEFFIRALCHAGLAHYGSVVASHPASRPIELARSAVLALANYYGSQQALPRFGEAVQQLNIGVARILNHVRQFEPHLIPLTIGDDVLVDQIAVLFQLGRRNADVVYPLLDRVAQDSGLWESDVRPTAYSIRSAMVPSLNEATPARRRSSPETLLRDLWRYELLRDIGRYIAANAIRHDPSKGDARGSRAGALIIDDRLFEWLEQGKPDTHDRFPERLEALLHVSGWAQGCVVASSRRSRRGAATSDHDFQAPIKSRDLATGRLREVRARNFEVVIMEVDSTRQEVGPDAVRRLWTALSAEPKRKYIPPIIVLTRTESFDYVQQSLNLGAKAYVLKERIYRLPAEIRAALESVQGYRDDTQIASSFRKLRVLPPSRRARLHLTGATHFLRGGREDECGRVTVDARERAWLTALPKGELHCHMGGCVSLSAVQTLALNTIGHLLGEIEFEELSLDIREVVVRTAFVVRLAEWLRLHFKDALPPLVLVAWAAAASVCKDDELKPLPAMGIGDLVVGWLHAGSGRIHVFEVAALLVSLLSIRERLQPRADTSDPEPEEFLKGLASSLTAVGDATALGIAGRAAADQFYVTASSWSGEKRGELPGIGRDPVGRALWNHLAKDFGVRISRARSVLKREYRSQGERLCGRHLASHSIMQMPISTVLGRLERVQEKLGISDFMAGNGSVSATVRGAIKGGIPAGSADTLLSIGLHDCVTVPLIGRPGEYRARGLRRYLWGSDLLGAENFQYPENLLVAAYALTLDNAVDNVTYCEVRCETTGYCKAGMNAYDATELLCRGFDVAAHFLHSRGKPLVRTNVLLAAKRHKRKEAARRVVALLELFLERRTAANGDGSHGPWPTWWRPARPVGFDLSGDEAVDAPWLDEVIDPLARLSSPVTIHAGEAATAESVWKAVYRYHATRIGHGLRLREDNHLLGYCVNEGICMEMCPTSNSFTNAFHAHRDGTFPTYADNPRSAYPLQEFMRAGLEVAIGTDNRYLHPPGRRTLTSEYLTACRLSGGLTRWEVLQLVKSGFKNAFLPKDEVKELLSEMEERIYAIISTGLP